MKIVVALLLCASLAANVLLFQKRSTSRTPSSVNLSAGGNAAITAPTLSAETWELIASGDLSGPQKLRELGLPESLINRLVRYQVDQRYRDRERALYPDQASAEYWKPSYNYARWTPIDPTKSVDLRREKDAELKALLGADYRKDDINTDPRTAFLPADKAEQLRMIDEDYSALRQRYSNNDGINMPEDREKLAFLEKQKRTDLAEILTPEELAAYDLRNSTTANTLRYQLSTMDITEDEFKTLYDIRKPFDEKNPASNASAISFVGSADKDREALDAQVKAALGDERFAAYQRAQDYDFKTLSKLATRLELPPEKAVEAYTLKTALEKKLKEFKPQPGSDIRQQRTDFLAGLARDAETGFTQILGEKGYATYKDYGQIFRRIQPPQIPAASSGTTATPSAIGTRVQRVEVEKR